MRKILFIVVLSACAFGQMPNQKPIQGVLVDNGHELSDFVGAWFFNDNPGVTGTTYDLSGNGNHGTLVADTHSVPGKFGPALDFDGTGDYLTTPLVWSNDGPVSVCFWAKVTGTAETLAIGGSGDDAAADRLFVGLPWDDSLDWDYGDSGGDGRIQHNISSYYGLWTQYVLTSQGAGGSFKGIYINGDLKISSGVSDGPSGDINFYIGGVSTYAPSFPFNGAIDHLVLYDRALSASEIASLYAEPFQMFEKEALIVNAAAAAPAGGQVIIIMMSSLPVWAIFIVAGSFAYSRKRAA